LQEKENRDALSSIRPAQGFAPRQIDLGEKSPRPILAVGADKSNTVTIIKASQAYISEPVGDLIEPGIFDHFRNEIESLCTFAGVRPEVLASDLNPDYLSTQYGYDQTDLDIINIQHHHAHLVSCMVDHRLVDRVIGIIADGAGMGTDNAMWGCELLVADRAEYQRVGHLDYFRLPGFAASSRQTFRPAMGLLYETFGEDTTDLPVVQKIYPDSQTRKMIVQMLQKKINCPQTSSLGRLFDAAAAMLGLASTNHYDGEAPQRLENAAQTETDEEYPFELKISDETTIIDFRPMILQMVSELNAATEISLMASKFHNTVSSFLSQSAIQVAKRKNISYVVLSGGCFANRKLNDKLSRRLTAAGLNCFQHRRISCGDSGLSLGQAAIAAARLIRGFTF